MASELNPLGLLGIEFTEFASPDSDFMHKVFIDFGFSLLKKAKNKDILYYKQNDINFLLNKEREGFSAKFAKSHGPAICSMGWRVEDASFAHRVAVERGAKAADDSAKDLPYPAIYGIGDSLIYFIDTFGADNNIYATDFEDLSEQVITQEKGFITEVRYFDISGVQTALVSYALRSPDGSFCIPINEGKGNDKNQIDEYLKEYNGPGVQHLAFRSRDIVKSLDAMEGSSIQCLDIIPEYYDTIFDKVPQVTENRERIKHHQILVDGDESGYLLQIFTKNLFGPIFIEIIQRKNNLGFGEGNFTALFQSIERDQMRRGVL